MKNICVFGSSSESIDREFLDSAESLGRALARKGYAMIFGAGKYGVMGASARGVKAENGELIGVSPDFFIDLNVLDDDCTELIITKTIRKYGKRSRNAVWKVITAGVIRPRSTSRFINRYLQRKHLKPRNLKSQILLSSIFNNL